MTPIAENSSLVLLEDLHYSRDFERRAAGLGR